MRMLFREGSQEDGMMQSNWNDTTPRTDLGEQDPFRPDNCDGYTQEAMDALNIEFWLRWNHGGEWDTGYTLSAALKIYQNEVARRRLATEV
jgi:hypothetical protein